MEHKNEEQNLMMKYLRRLDQFWTHIFLKKLKHLDQQQNQY